MANGNYHSVVDFNDSVPNIPDNYASYTLKNEELLPPGDLNWLHVAILSFMPILGFVGAYFTCLRWETDRLDRRLTAGYHRLWAHRSYNTSRTLQFALALLGAGAVDGSIGWWERGHRAHHRYTDTDLDPYNAQKGLLWSHVGWMIIKPRRKSGVAGSATYPRTISSDGGIVTTSIILPTVAAGLGWGDWKGGYAYASLLRIVIIHHSTFCVNLLAYWLGEAPFDDKYTLRDHLITALVTIGEGYHDFHHQFPMDYRNAIRRYQYDPTKWFIWAREKVNLASHLKRTEVRKGQLTMHLKRLHETQEMLSWPSDNGHLPVISWESYRTQAKTQPLICIAGLIHDMVDFLDEHPDGHHLLTKIIGRGATTAMLRWPSRLSDDLLDMKRVGILHGGAPHGLEDKLTPGMGGSGSSSATLSDGEGLLG
ncbi:hypothetical protein EDC04DRAFT_2868935 [Pisolithus marmoratus]|nr:hypothetical protein EDC04DRAFT_2868935 [Pisolithus marmoratus]